MDFKELSQAARGRIKIVELQCAADLQKELEGKWSRIRDNKSWRIRPVPNSSEDFYYNPLWEYTRAFVNQIAQEYFAAVDGPDFVTILNQELLPEILQSVTDAWRKAVDNSLDATGFTFAIITGMPSWNREGVQAIDFTTRLRAALQPAVNEWERRAEDRLIQRQIVRPADTSESSVTPDDPQNQSTLSSKNIAEFASRVELEKWVNLVEQLRTRAAAPVFAQPPDPTGTFSASTVPNPESSWPESEVVKSRAADNLTVSMDVLSDHGSDPELGLLPDDWLVGEIKSRAHFERVLQSPGGPLSLLRHCVLSLHRALFETYPRLSNLNLEQFWSSREVRVLFEQFLSRKFGESWSDKEAVNSAYIALKAWLYGYIADVRRAVPGQNGSERRRGTMADSSVVGKSSTETYESTWSISGDGRDTFNRLAWWAEDTLGRGHRNPTEAADVWLNDLHRFHKRRQNRYARHHREITNIFEAAAERCADWCRHFHAVGDLGRSQKFADLERQFRKWLSDHRVDLCAIRRRDTCLRRDSYPLNNGLYDHSHKPLADLKGELDYWKDHAWRRYHALVENCEGVAGRSSANREELLKQAIGGLSYDLAVLQANYIIDCGLRDNKAAVKAFKAAKIREEVVSSWRAGCKRLVLSFEDESEGVKDLIRPFHRVRGDLRRLLDELPAGPQGEQGNTEAAREDPAGKMSAVVPQPSSVLTETKISAGSAEKLLAHPIAKLDKPLPEPPPRVGGGASAFVPSKLKVTGTINYNFPSDFPPSSRDRVKSEEILAARDCNEKINSAHSERELSKLRRACAVRPVSAFCLEARHLHWGVDRIDRHIRDFVLLGAQKWAGLATDSEARREFEESDEWKQYLDLLLGMVDKNEVPAEQPVLAANIAPMPAAEQPASPVPDQPERTSPPEQNIHTGLGPVQDAHVALLEMILTKVPTTLEKWASEHKIGRTTVFDWKSLRSAGKSLQGKVSVEKTASIEKAIEDDAKALGLDTGTNSD